jgi:UDPglucose 6-dehydrogenase
MDGVLDFVNIIGYGYVGSGMGYLCKKNKVGFCTYDVIKKEESEAYQNFDKIEDLVKNSEQFNKKNIYYICVPTPSKESGECDLTIVHVVLSQLKSLVTKESLVMIKSTVEPGSSRNLNSMYGNEMLKIVFCPEFLREKTFEDDIYNAEFVMLGFENLSDDSVEHRKTACDVMKLLYSHNPNIEMVCKLYEECELFKYTINVYLSVKVWYFNELSLLSDKFGIEYKSLQDLFKYDKRIGESHTDVPGHDGMYGFGGKCLPKETKAMSYLQNKLQLDNTVLQNILKRNFEMRGE